MAYRPAPPGETSERPSQETFGRSRQATSEQLMKAAGPSASSSSSTALPPGPAAGPVAEPAAEPAAGPATWQSAAGAWKVGLSASC